MVEPHGRVPGRHVHPGQQESFEILDGTVQFRKACARWFPSRVTSWTYHRFANAGGTTAVVRCRVELAMRMVELFETVAALAAEGRSMRSGLPRSLDLALFTREFRGRGSGRGHARSGPGRHVAARQPHLSSRPRRALRAAAPIPSGAGPRVAADDQRSCRRRSNMSGLGPVRCAGVD